MLKQEGFQQKEQKGLLATLGSLVDNDPEGTRRNTISKLKDGLVELETKRENARKVLLDMNGNIQAELDRFQRDKISDMRQMLIRHAQSQKEYHEKACQAWYQARQSSN